MAFHKKFRLWYVCLRVHHKLTCKWQMRYLDGGILAAKAACRVFDLGEGGISVGDVEEGRLRALGDPQMQFCLKGFHCIIHVRDQLFASLQFHIWR